MILRSLPVPPGRAAAEAHSVAGLYWRVPDGTSFELGVPSRDRGAAPGMSAAPWPRAQTAVGQATCCEPSIPLLGASRTTLEPRDNASRLARLTEVTG